ncbi:hypothetical protein GGX14DRAFT_556139 [Mycena pura]|uniref:Ribonuclease H1 N-terminal domain-containing protein n=1 Tax=Mycena pura TaxID=153505 RepID=A0AAD7E2P8_9AGAR|nr:hypothetical protein GGX14DRAFT_556139 [Mycena pura]
MQIKPALPQNDSRLEALERRIAELEQTLASLEVGGGGTGGCNTDHPTPEIVRDTRDAQVRDTSEAQVRDTREGHRERPTTPPPAAPPPPSTTPPPTAPPPPPATTPPSSARRVYQLSSPTQPPTYTQYWTKVQRATKGFRHSVQQGYPTVSQATRAYEYAQEQGWTLTVPRYHGLMLDIASVPRPLETNDPAVIGDRLDPRIPEDPWYIVYKGVNPGIFPTFLECALNTSGVKGASYDKWPTFVDALRTFNGAKRRGEVAELT